MWRHQCHPNTVHFILFSTSRIWLVDFVELLVNKPLLNTRNEEQTNDVRMYIEEFILVDIWIHCCTKLDFELNSIERMLVYIHSQQRNEICENYS